MPTRNATETTAAVTGIGTTINYPLAHYRDRQLSPMAVALVECGVEWLMGLAALQPVRHSLL